VVVKNKFHAGNQVLKRRTTLLLTPRLHQILRMYPEHVEWCAHFVGGISDETPTATPTVRADARNQLTGTVEALVYF